jgi:hypothetical protein
MKRLAWGNEVLYAVENPADFGFPPIHQNQTPPCNTFLGGESKKACSEEGM